MQKEIPNQKESSENTDINEFVRKFPDKIPGVSAVKKYPIEESKHCLIHIRQEHYLSVDQQLTYLQFLSPKDRQSIIRTQKNIEQILTFLSQKYGIQSIHIEGFSSSRIKKWKSAQKRLPTRERLIENDKDLNLQYGLDLVFLEIRQLERELLKLQHKYEDAKQEINKSIQEYKRYRDMKTYVGKIPTDDERKGILKWQLDVLISDKKTASAINVKLQEKSLELAKKRIDFSHHIDEISYLRGAAEKMFFEHKINLLPVHSDKFKQRYLQSTKVDREVMYEKRENELLRMCSMETQSVHITVFGGGHKLYLPNNDAVSAIEKWNTTYPEKKYSLIEITPISYAAKLEELP